MMGQMVALVGPRGSGKSTIAQYLVDDHGFERLALRVLPFSKSWMDGSM